MEELKYDVIIVGTGAAGLFAALSIKENKKIMMITKDEMKKSDSYLAQGGISVLLGKEDYHVYFEDTMKAGRYENRIESVNEMIQSSGGIINNLIEYGVDFDRDTEGKLEYTREGGHSTFRILHHKDVTGKEVVRKLIKAVERRSNIEISEYTTMMDLMTKGNNCYGIIVNKNGVPTAYKAGAIVLATGGVGGLFHNSTNYEHITGDGCALAFRHNVEVEHMNYIQIHPTALYSKKAGRKYLISESVRGEGAELLNEEGKRFVDELLPRDIVTGAIREQMEKYHTDHVYLSFKKVDSHKIMEHFPNIYNRCMEDGYDIRKDLIPVAPAQHYLMGGIKVNINGETSMRSLYAIGETACNGVHGANRLASNSLLESLVFAKNTAERINKKPVEEQNFYTPVICEERYTDLEEWEKKNKEILRSAIEREDMSFYDKWNNA